MLVREPRQLLDTVAHHPGVRVEQQEVAAGGEPHPGVVAAAHTDVLLLDHARFGEARANDLDGPGRRTVVYDDRLVAAHALESAVDPGLGVEGDDDGGVV